jgi:AraC family transcriptional regulator of adaptative response / DNA-3-methyladenine glycosylase II
MLVRLGYRPPYDAAAMVAFFRHRAIVGLEQVGPAGDGAQLARTLQIDAAGRCHAGWITATFDVERHQLVLRVSDGLQEVLPQVIRRARATFDLDCDPLAVNGVLHAAFPGADGLRVPGAFSGWELAVRAVLGQQVTVAAARTLAQRLVERFGAPIATGQPQLNRLFPTAETLAQAEDDALGALGIVRQRQAAIVALARAVHSGALQLNPGADAHSTTLALKQLPGIGDWTAQYIAMRALRWPDAFPAGDVALQKALGVQHLRQPAREAEAASQGWKPWRSYAVIRAWSRLAPSSLPTDTP